MSELRQDLVSGDWIILSPERANRENLSKIIKKKKRSKTPISKCPFEDLKKSGNYPLIFSYPNEKKWQIVIFQNKYPALRHNGVCAKKNKVGPFTTMTGVGHHDLLVTRDHNKDFSRLSNKLAFLVFKTLKEYINNIKKDRCLSYISFFHNFGALAGATIDHPHYQIIALPIVPPDVNSSLTGSWRYFKERRSCIHCQMIKFEKEQKKRIIFEDNNVIAFSPFFSKEPFEVRIFPKKHLSSFEATDDKMLMAVSSALKIVLQKINKNLNFPDYNFFIHTAPIKGDYHYYHWHIEVLPKLSFVGGFELGTGVNINIIDPDLAAEILNK